MAVHKLWPIPSIVQSSGTPGMRLYVDIPKEAGFIFKLREGCHSRVQSPMVGLVSATSPA